MTTATGCRGAPCVETISPAITWMTINPRSGANLAPGSCGILSDAANEQN